MGGVSTPPYFKGESMILKTDKIRVDIDRVSFLYDENCMMVVDGQSVTTLKEEYDSICRAFDRVHLTHTYDTNLKKEGRH